MVDDSPGRAPGGTGVGFARVAAAAHRRGPNRAPVRVRRWRPSVGSNRRLGWAERRSRPHGVLPIRTVEPRTARRLPRVAACKPTWTHGSQPGLECRDSGSSSRQPVRHNLLRRSDHPLRKRSKGRHRSGDRPGSDGEALRHQHHRVCSLRRSIRCRPRCTRLADHRVRAGRIRIGVLIRRSTRQHELLRFATRLGVGPDRCRLCKSHRPAGDHHDPSIARADFRNLPSFESDRRSKGELTPPTAVRAGPTGDPARSVQEGTPRRYCRGQNARPREGQLA